MKRSLALVALVALVATSHQASAAPKKKPKVAPPKPVTVTHFFHGVDNNGTKNGNVNVVAGNTTGILPMDTKAPGGGTEGNYGTVGVANNPNHSCLGNGLTMHPTWMGTASGTLTGTLTVKFYARSTPGKAIVQLFVDAPDELQCNENYPGSVVETKVDLPVKEGYELVTATLRLPKAKVMKRSLTIQITTDDTLEPQVSDVAFDSTAFASAVTFTCIPNPAKKTC